jgi:hypothetical protein
MGFGGAFDRTLGRSAVSVASHLRLVALAGCLMTLAGCTAIGGFLGAGAAFATGAATANPIVGISVGIGVKAAAEQGLQYFARRTHRDEQDAIAEVVRNMEPGQSGRWEHAHRIGSGVDRGEVRVVRVIETPLAMCKELLFSVEREGEKPRVDWFTTTACRNGDVWQWAAAEPAVERWGNLQ